MNKLERAAESISNISEVSYFRREENEESILLDGYFKLEELKSIVFFMENSKEEL